MRGLWTVLLLSGMALGQAADAPKPPNSAAGSAPAAAPSLQPSVAAKSNVFTIPAGTKIPLLLKQAISTKNAHEGDAVYAETAFPYVVDDRVIVPAGSYIQGTILDVGGANGLQGAGE